MKKAAKRLTVLFVVLASLVASQNTAYAAVARKELPLKLHKQNTPVWCWGAAIAMVADYTQNFDVKDCEVLAEYDMRLGGRGLCCLNAPECVRSGQPNEIASILGGIFGVHGTLNNGPLSFSDVKEQIDSGRPIIAALMKPTGGHVVVVSGYENANKVIVLDPIHGRSIVSYNVLTSNWQYGNWVQSFVITSYRSSTPLCERKDEYVTAPNGAQMVRKRASCSSNDAPAPVPARRTTQVPAVTTNTCEAALRSCVSLVKSVDRCLAEDFPGECIKSCIEHGNSENVCRNSMCTRIPYNIKYWSESCQITREMAIDSCNEEKDKCEETQTN